MLRGHDEYLAQSFEAGASGYLLKDLAGRELGSAIRRVMQGEFVIGESLTKTPGLLESALGQLQDRMQTQVDGAAKNTTSFDRVDARGPEMTEKVSGQGVESEPKASATESSHAGGGGGIDRPTRWQDGGRRSTKRLGGTKDHPTGSQSNLKEQSIQADEVAKGVALPPEQGPGNREMPRPQGDQDKLKLHQEDPETTAAAENSQMSEAELIVSGEIQPDKLAGFYQRLKEVVDVEILETVGSSEHGILVRILVPHYVELPKILSTIPYVAEIKEESLMSGGTIRRILGKPKASSGLPAGVSMRLRLVLKAPWEPKQLSLLG